MNKSNSDSPKDKKSQTRGRFRMLAIFSNLKGFKNLKIGRKLDLGFGILVVLMFLVVWSIFVAGRRATQNINITEEIRVPAALASAQAQSSLLEMQASLRGYLVLGDLNNIDTYNKAKEVFEISLTQLDDFSKEWNSIEDIHHLEELKAVYNTWSPIPEQLFKLHQNPLENQPALRIYSLEYQPVNIAIHAKISELELLLEKQNTITSDESELLAVVTDFETTFDAMATNLRAYVTSGDVAFKSGYAKSLDNNTVAWRDLLARQTMLNEGQKDLLTKITNDREQILAIPLQIFEAVEGKHTYEDLFLYESEVEPEAQRMLQLLSEITTAQQALLQTDLNAGRRSLNLAQYSTLIGGLLALVFGFIMTYVLRSNIVRPIQRLTNIAEQITIGDFTAQAQVESQDEIGQLANTLNIMTNRLRETIDRLAKLYHMSEGMTSARTLSELIAVIVEGGNIPVINRAVLNMFEYDEAGEVEAMVIEANWYSGSGQHPSTLGTRYLRSVNDIINVFLSHEPLFFDNIQQDIRTDPATLSIVQRQNIRAMVVLPLWSQGQQLGVLILEGEEAYNFSREEIDPYMALLGQLTVAIENRRLFEQIQQRANELAVAKEAAEKASRAKSEFLTNMSHELRTPLNGILGYAHILKRYKHLSESQINAVNVIQESGEHLLTLINDILDISKIEASKLELYPSDFCLPDFLEGIARMFEIRAQQKPDVEFTYQRSSTLPSMVYADEKRLRQVLINLLSNAFKFTDEGYVALRVWTKLQDVKHKSDEQIYADRIFNHYALIHFEVEDTGIGMTPQQLDRIFLPFVQVGDVRRRVEGTGLGLAITKNLVETMGSTLEVKSEPGQGSIFNLDLEFPVTQATGKSSTLPGYNIVGYVGQRRKILVVDDEAHNRSMLVDMLEPIGFDVIVVGSGQESIDISSSICPDVILMDLIMPDMSGIEAIKAIRGLDTLRDKGVAIIATSASVNEELQSQSKLVGCDKFLAKPIVAESLLRAIETQLDLEWIYDESPDETSLLPENILMGETELLIHPPPEEITILFDLAKKGDLSRLRKRVRQVEQMNEEFKPFAQQLHQLVDEVDEDRILALLEQYVDKTE